jgi:hypothetical protein
VGRFSPGVSTAAAAEDELASASGGGGPGGSGAAAAALRHGVASAMLRAADEADTAARLRAALAREAQTQPESESDSEEDDEDDGEDASMRACRPHGVPAASGMDEEEEGEEGGDDDEGTGVDPREHAECVAAFARVMRERFLSGKEDAAHVNYAAVDSDATLDERWAREAGQDAEDAYFGED